MLPTDAELEREKAYLHQRINEIKNLQDVKAKIEEEQQAMEGKSSSAEGLSGMWNKSLESLKKGGTK